MKIASIGDIHAGQHNIVDTEIGMREVGYKLDEHSVEILIITGDLFHEFNIGGKTESSGSVLSSVLEPLNDFLDVDERRKIIIIPGNHDMSTEKNAKDALTPFDYRKQIYVSRTIKAFRISSHIMITTLPWMYPSMYLNKADLLIQLEQIRNESLGYTNILAGHCEIDGSDILSGYTMFGGHFNFTKDEIDDLGYDAVTLGHVHKTQYHYTGSPWQQSFGDEGAIGKIRVWNIEGGIIKDDKLVQIPNTPKYWNISLDQVEAFGKSDIDHVKVIGKKLIVDLPEGYLFEKEKSNVEIKQRTSVSTDDDISVLLGKWMKEKGYHNISVADLVAILNEIGVSTSYNTKFGSLDRFESVKIQGIGSHKDTYMDFTDPIIAISGGNGVGKTQFMESLFAGLYGDMPSYGKLANLADDVALLETVFRTNNAKYKVIRKINKGKNSAWIYRNENSLPLVGPKVSEVNAKITQLVGPKELLLSSVFSVQTHAGDIVDLESSKRKDIFHKLLGLQVFADMREVVSDKFKESKTKRGMLTSQYLGIKTLEQLHKEVTNISDLLNKTQIELGNHEGKLVSYSLKLDKAEKELITLNNVLDFKARTEDELLQNRNALTITHKKLDNFTLIDVDELEEKLELKQADFAILERGYVEQRAQFEELEELKNEYNDALRDLQAHKNTTIKFEADHNNKVAELKEKGKALDNIGCSDDPLPCYYIDEAKGIGGEIEVEELKFTVLLEECNNKTIMFNDRIKTTRCAMNDYKDSMKKCTKEEYDKLKNEISNICNSIESAEDHNLKKIDLFQDQTYYLDKISQAKTILTDMGDTTREKQIVLTNQIQGHKDSLAKERLLATAKEVAIAEYKKDLTYFQEELEKLIDLDEQMKVLNAEIPKLEILNEALGKNGIPQLIIDSALPQLQCIIDIIAEFINKFSITIATQKPNKDGTNAKETIDFIVDDGIKPRDVKFYSGGEKKLLKTLIRLSLSLFQSQRTGNSYKLLLMDETFDALDTENSLMLLKIIYNLRTKFRQIFVISHSDDVIGRLDNSKQFRREGNRTMIDG
jgi:DNA repair exonuclease SbcCD ATPase subunit/DNA repair exonuclease SbcCD nuclease subunit